MPTNASPPLARTDLPGAFAVSAGADVRALLRGLSTTLRNDPAALAAALGVCRSDLWRWETGEPPSAEEQARIERLARHLDRLVQDGTVRAIAGVPRPGPGIRS